MLGTKKIIRLERKMKRLEKMLEEFKKENQKARILLAKKILEEPEQCLAELKSIEEMDEYISKVINCQ